MTTINLTNLKDPVRVLQNAVKPNANPRGTWLIYHEGSYADNVNQTKLGRAAWELYKAGVIVLVQKKLQDEPRVYAYVGVVV